MSAPMTHLTHLAPSDVQSLRKAFGERLQIEAPLARLTAARVGGSADALVEVRSIGQLVEATTQAWQIGLPFMILGGGSNVLVSDAGVRGLVVLNRARRVRWLDAPGQEPPSVWAEAGANFGALARQAGERGLAGLEWAAGIPGTLGGAIFGNAGAHGADMASNLLLAEILHLEKGEAPQHETWTPEQLEYGYRTSLLKRQAHLIGSRYVVLAGRLHLERSTPQLVKDKLEVLVDFRRRTQPPGASMGSMFKNPPGDYAGRLIEAAGLKGARRGDVEISQQHANFFVNSGKAKAADILTLIQLTQDTVAQKFGVTLELEIELLGEWPEGAQAKSIGE